MADHERGFFSIDALFAVTLLILVSASFLNLYEGRKQSAELMGARLEARLVCEKIVAGLNTVYANGSNFELLLDLPDNLGGYGYQVTLDNDTQQISVENSEWGAVNLKIAFENVEDFVLGQENLSTAIRVYWEDNQIRVVNA